MKPVNHATVEYNFMRENYQYYGLQTGGTESDDSLVMALVNTRSLKKHAIDVKYDLQRLY